MTAASTQTIPQAFVWRRLHSITGVWLVVFLITHLFTNSQAALFIGDDGHGFIRAVNSIHDMPYLPLIEIAVLAFPILVHLLWGLKYLHTAKYNSFGQTGKTPYLPNYPRNHAYTWQRITAWLLVLGIIAHVVQMRFVEYPVSAAIGSEHAYMVRVSEDDGLYTVAERLGVRLYNSKQIQSLTPAELSSGLKPAAKGELMEGFMSSLKGLFNSSESGPVKPQQLLRAQAHAQEVQWLEALKLRPLKEGEVVAVAGDFGTAELLMLRDTFKSPFMLVLYTLLVLATCFHAFNGLWTAMIAWGVTLTVRAQYLMLGLSSLLMVAFAFLGLSAVWLTYWINLKY